MITFRSLRRTIRQLVWLCGFEIVREPRLRVRLRREPWGLDAIADIKRLLGNCQAPMICDVGANEGQSIRCFREVFPGAVIHSFEPSPTTYQRLRSAVRSDAQLTLWNLGLGAVNGTLPLKENDHSDMSSFLDPGSGAWGQIVRETQVSVTTLDTFAKDQGIQFIHLLKSDTQGFDLEVFKGARELMQQNRIALIFCEVIFSDMYVGLPRFRDVLRLLEDNGFAMVGIYDQHFHEGRVSWADVLFISRGFSGK